MIVDPRGTIRSQVKDLSPSTAYLFGDHVKDRAKDIVASQQLDPFSGGGGGGFKKAKRGGHHQGGTSGRGGEAGGSFTRQYGKPKGGSQPPRGRGGAKRGERLSKFKDD